MWSIFKAFFILGCISFGGPAAHIGYFRETFVQRLVWLSERQYGEFVALSQFLPGPGSSQVGFAIGYHRAGLLGACCAFLGFTLPSIALVLSLAISAVHWADNSIVSSSIHALKLLAVVVVFDAVLIMYKNFCKDNQHLFICLLSACTLLIFPGVIEQLLVLTFSATYSICCFKVKKIETTKKAKHCLITHPLRSVNYFPLVLFLVLLLLFPLLNELLPTFPLFSDFFQAGSFVFGGGHVVLPLLQNIVEGQISPDQFLTGYAIAQAVPGPMFTFATYIGYFMLPNSPILGALIATIGVFLPGFLLLLGFLKNWKRLASIPNIRIALDGINAAVVGLLISALYNPVFTSAVFHALDMALVLIGIYLLKVRKWPVMGLVGSFILVGASLAV